MRTGHFRALCLLSTTTLWLTAPARADDQPAPAGPDSGSITVEGQIPEPLFFGIKPDRELDQNDIAAYGADTIGEVIDEVSRGVPSHPDGPVVLLNGQLTNGLSDVADLPAEAATRVEILPSTVAARFGQSPTRPVINVVIRPDLLQFTAFAQAGWSTRGDAFTGDGELNFLKLQNNNRRSLVLRAGYRDPLFERDRGIVPDTSGTPFDLIGNVLSYPVTGGEIDPALSALAHTLVTVAAVPQGVAKPTLADFAARANSRNLSDLGLYRTLIGQGESYTANANMTQRLSPVTTLSLTGTASLTRGTALTGASGALLRIPVGSAYSPFSRDVSVARWVGNPLEQSSEGTALALNGVLNSQVGKFRVSLTGLFNHTWSRTLSDRDYDLAALQAGIVAGSINPFAAIDPGSLGAPRTDRARSLSDDAFLQAVATGPLFALPAGDVRATAQLSWRHNSFTASTVGTTVNSAGRFSRNQESAQVNFEVPLAGGAHSPIGALSADVTGEVHEDDAAGTLNNWAAAINWLPDPAFNLRASLSEEEVAPQPSALTAPVVVIDNFRTFDFVRQETVLVRYITGGNPALPVQRNQSFNVGAVLTPFPKLDLRINAAYEHRVIRNALAGLPPASAAVQLAFADRYLRNGSGVLVQLDARPVTYQRDARDLLHWNLDFKHTYAAGRLIGGGAGTDPSNAGSGWRVNLNIDHTWTLTNTRLARTGLPVIDLLDGGALGYGGGQPRHQVLGQFGVAHRGFGAQLDSSWQSGSSIRAGTTTSPSDVEFAPRLLVNARVFANLGPLLPNASWAKGTRLSFMLNNLFDSSQRVTNTSGATPLRYQPFLIDPLGRSFAISLRKVF